jgi:hypothetical protein
MLRRFSLNYVLFSLFADVTCVVGAFLLGLYLRRTLPYGRVGLHPDGIPRLVFYPIAIVLWIVIAFAISLYDPRKRYKAVDEYQMLVLAVAGALYFTFRDTSRLLVAYALAALGLLLGAWRVFARRHLHPLCAAGDGAGGAGDQAGFPWPGPFPAAAGGGERSPVHHVQVPLHGPRGGKNPAQVQRDRRGRERHSQEGERSPRDAGGAIHPPHQCGRTAPVIQCVERRHEPGGAEAGVALAGGGVRALAAQAVRRAPGHHRLVAGERPL